MLDDSQANNDEVNIGNVENNNPRSTLSSGDGVNLGNKARQALLKKGGRKLRSPHQQKPPRGGLGICLSDHNNNNTLALPSVNRHAVQPGSELPAGTQTVLTLHQLNQGPKKEVTSGFVCVYYLSPCSASTEKHGSMFSHDDSLLKAR